jgi:hypothetical protein
LSGHQVVAVSRSHKSGSRLHANNTYTAAHLPHSSAPAHKAANTPHRHSIAAYCPQRQENSPRLDRLRPLQIGQSTQINHPLSNPETPFHRPTRPQRHSPPSTPNSASTASKSSAHQGFSTPAAAP